MLNSSPTSPSGSLLPSPVIEADRLRSADIEAVARGEALAIRIDRYYEPRHCLDLSRRLLSSSLWTTYEEGSGAEDIGTIGDSLFGCMGQELCESYFEAGKIMYPRLREIVQPLFLPVDAVLMQLDHRWPHGANLLRIGGEPAFYGLVRVFRSGGAALPHTDRADWDFPSSETAGLQAQLFVNCYLSKTTEGGGVRLWDRRIDTKAEYDALRRAPGHYALRDDALGEPTVELDPPVGGLLIANAWKVHAVAECGGEGERLSVSGFIGYSGPDRPLRLFS